MPRAGKKVVSAPPLHGRARERRKGRSGTPLKMAASREAMCWVHGRFFCPCGRSSFTLRSCMRGVDLLRSVRPTGLFVECSAVGCIQDGRGKIKLCAVHGSRRLVRRPCRGWHCGFLPMSVCPTTCQFGKRKLRPGRPGTIMQCLLYCPREWAGNNTV